MRSGLTAILKDRQTRLLFTVVILFSALCGYLLANFTPGFLRSVFNVAAVEDEQVMIATRGGGYEFINPLLECDNFHPSRLNSMVKLEDELNNYIRKTLEEKTATHVSIYFRALNSGPWLGVNEHESYAPASLLKVPLMIALLKKAEAQPDLLQAMVRFEKPAEKFTQNIRSGNFIVPGNTYSVSELMERMIIYSDNEAKELLFNVMGDAWVEKCMAETGINLADALDAEDFVSVKEYSSFFRLLFNATYLNREMSEKALKILSKSQFKAGIPKFLPKNIKVAHKFGERNSGFSSQKQLHDCGIVYFPGSPYLLCVMTRGGDFNKLANVIAEISGIVYRNVNASA